MGESGAPQPHADILVVDDTPPNLQLAVSLLRGVGYQVRGVPSGELALTEVEQRPPDLILLDIKMPMMDGFEVCAELKRRDQTREIPIIFLSALDDPREKVRAFEMGGVDYITKPFDFNEVQARVKAQLKILANDALRRENELMRERLEAIFFSVQEGIVTVDEELRLLSTNSAARRLFDLGDGVEEGSLFPAVAACCGPACIQALRRVVEGGDGEELKAAEYVVAGDPRIYTMSVNPLRGADSRGAVLVVRDETRIARLEEALAEHNRFHRMIGRSVAMRSVFELIRKLGDTPVPVLVTGESGTGKELVAEALHREWFGEDEGRPFIRVNCAALPDELLESELFGHVKGAFTGALRDRPGRFEMAHGGTIFLDEIGDTTLKTQLRLLRVLQEREVERVGGGEPIEVDFQLVTATNRDLRELVREERFREDLYHRLRVMHIELPPLRERREDIHPLVEYFLKELNLRFDRRVSGVTAEVQRLFMEYAWPGNIRELIHVLEYAFVIAEGDFIGVSDLPRDLLEARAPRGRVPGHGAATPTVPHSAGDEDEKARILRVLEEVRWNKSAAAKVMGIERRTLYRRMKRLGIAL